MNILFSYFLGIKASHNTKYTHLQWDGELEDKWHEFLLRLCVQFRLNSSQKHKIVRLQWKTIVVCLTNIFRIVHCVFSWMSTFRSDQHYLRNSVIAQLHRAPAPSLPPPSSKSLSSLPQTKYFQDYLSNIFLVSRN